jgi:hypothetical protein
MTFKFNVGDKVKVISDDTDNNLGYVGIIRYRFKTTNDNRYTPYKNKICYVLDRDYTEEKSPCLGKHGYPYWEENLELVGKKWKQLIH